MIETTRPEVLSTEPLSNTLLDALNAPGVEIVDLTYPLEAGMPTFTAPWHPAVTVTQMGRIDVEGRTTHSFTLGTHTGTHIDAPLHFIEHGKGIEAIPLSKLMGPVGIIDCTHFGMNGAVTVDFLRQFPIKPRMIFRFGWEQHWKTPQFFNDWPYFTNEAAQYLVDNGMQLIGLDTPSPDDSRIPFKSEHDSQVHKIFLKREVVILEYVANLASVTELEGWILIVMPLKLKGLDGAPSRVCLVRPGKPSFVKPGKNSLPDIQQWLQDWFLKNSLLTPDGVTADFAGVNYFESGLVDSFGYMELIAEIEACFGIEFSNADFQEREFATVGGLSKAIERYAHKA